ncbi:type II toxin-antitoxin system VapB family antitoxin [bacterium]|nr:type II toxin-antitoxin system VapB family antitoxin [bacterium]
MILPQSCKFLFDAKKEPNFCRFLAKIRRMATDLAINPKLLDEALKAGGQKTKKATVEAS